MKTADITYIFHVIGTLEQLHVARALKSLWEQEPFRWRRFVLHNCSPMATEMILPMVPRDLFEEVTVLEPTFGLNRIKSCSADWAQQMSQVDGTERYLSHKADFYLPPTVCRDFQRISKRRGEFIVLFNKYDMKSCATLADIQRFARMPWREGIADPEAGTYQKHLGKLAIPFEQEFGKMDGTMHGYTDGVRALYKPTVTEYYMRWGVAQWFRTLDRDHKELVLRDPRFFACHMWHDSPDRKDWNKNISPEERF